MTRRRGNRSGTRHCSKRCHGSGQTTLIVCIFPRVLYQALEDGLAPRITMVLS